MRSSTIRWRQLLPASLKKSRLRIAGDPSEKHPAGGPRFLSLHFGSGRVPYSGSRRTERVGRTESAEGGYLFEQVRNRPRLGFLLLVISWLCSSGAANLGLLREGGNTVAIPILAAIAAKEHVYNNSFSVVSSCAVALLFVSSTIAVLKNRCGGRSSKTTALIRRWKQILF